MGQSFLLVLELCFPPTYPPVKIIGPAVALLDHGTDRPGSNAVADADRGFVMDRVVLSALKIAAIYLLIGGLWIYFSDAALEFMVDDVNAMRWLQTWKGLGFILVTGLLVFWMSWRALHRQQALIRQLEEFAYHHPLTGLPTRAAALQRIDRAVRRARAEACSVGVISMDINGFSAINDGFGHEVGDLLLRAVADRISTSLNPKEFLAHPGGDKFIFVCEAVESDQDLDACVERLRSLLKASFDLPGISDLHVSFSAGVSTAPRDSQSGDTLLRYSEAALAKVKRSAPGSLQMFGPEIVRQASRRLALDCKLRQALAKGELVVHYQPIYQTRDRCEMVGLEALLRWPCKDGQWVPPAEFIPIAERTGLITEIGRWVINEVCGQIERWRENALEPVPVSVNISCRQLDSFDLVEAVTSAMERHRVEPRHLVLEITESSLMQKGDQALGFLQSLRSQGLRIALDDFGTGYSSLSYLRDLPFDILKIDRSFTANLERGQSDRDLAQAIITIADIFGLDVVAEGVETKAQQKVLEDLGCRWFQGLLFSKALPVDEVGDILVSNQKA